MNKQTTSAIVLARINFGESDKIITILTPDFGKIKLIARGVRKVKSKLAGGIELFSVSNISFIKGRSDMSTLVSTRLQTHFHHIVSDIDKTMTGYDILKFTNKATREFSDSDYYRLLLKTLTFLNDKDIGHLLTKCWFMARLLKLSGHSPNIERPLREAQFDLGKKYQYDYQESSFFAHTDGVVSISHIKVLKLLLIESPQRIKIIRGVNKTLPLIDNLLSQQIKYVA